MNLLQETYYIPCIHVYNNTYEKHYIFTGGTSTSVAHGWQVERM